MVPDDNNDARLMETLDGCESDCESQFPKQQEDIAAAVLALRKTDVSERKLSEAIRSWTIHGSVSLLDHLVEVGLIDDAIGQVLATEVGVLLTESMKNRQVGSASESLIARTLEAIDPTGRVSRLLGIQAAAGIV